jgi:predicted nucleic acid-binding protein
VRIFFDTNVYVAEAILGGAAERMLEATQRASWRTYCYEVYRVLKERLGFSHRLGILAQARIIRRSLTIEPGASRHQVPQDPDDSSVLVAALAAGVDFLVTNDKHLLALDPYEGMRIISMDAYFRLLVDEGLISD